MLKETSGIKKDFPHLALACLFLISLKHKKPVERSGKAKMSFFLLNKKPVEKNIIFARHARSNVYFCRKLPLLG